MGMYVHDLYNRHRDQSRKPHPSSDAQIDRAENPRTQD